MKNIIESTFGRSRVLLPVIHVRSQEQTLRNVETALKAKADGVFLISHIRRIGHTQLLDLYKVVRENFPDAWIGLNFLDVHNTAEAFNLVEGRGVDGMWTDYIEERTPEADSFRQNILERRAHEHTPLHFGGFAFKYGKHVDDKDLGGAAEAAISYTDVLTTSGTATGKAPHTEKIRTIREHIGDHPMAIASDITINNTPIFLPFCNAYLVSTGISDENDDLVSTKTSELAKRIHSVF